MDQNEKQHVSNEVPAAARHLPNAYKKEPGFVPTREELRVLARSWMEEYLENQLFLFLYQQNGGWESENAYALDRLDEIEEVAGKELVEVAIEEAREAMQERCPHIWDCFVRGDRNALGPVFSDEEEAEANPA
jgi:hypothetical protein